LKDKSDRSLRYYLPQEKDDYIKIEQDHVISQNKSPYVSMTDKGIFQTNFLNNFNKRSVKEDSRYLIYN